MPLSQEKRLKMRRLSPEQEISQLKKAIKDLQEVQMKSTQWQKTIQTNQLVIMQYLADMGVKFSRVN